VLRVHMSNQGVDAVESTDVVYDEAALLSVAL